MSRQALGQLVGIETSTSRCEVGLSDGAGGVLASRLPEGLKATAGLVPALAALSRQVGWPLRAVDLVCVDVGPGSYTGLRVGLTCAKTLAYAAGAPLVPVPSLDVVALNAPASERMLEVAFDAARGQVFARRYIKHADPVDHTNDHADGPIKVDRPKELAHTAGSATPLPQRTELLLPAGDWQPAGPIEIVAAEQWASNLIPGSLVLGPALVKYIAIVPSEHRVADESLWWPSSSKVIALGVERFPLSAARSYWSLEPIYLRLSAAEEKKMPRAS